MKFQMTLLVFREGEKQGEIDVIAEYPDAIAAIRAVAQLGATNSLLSAHPEVKALLKGVGSKALARMHESMGEGVVMQIKSVIEHRVVMPEELRTHPYAFHIISSRPERKVPREGILETLHDGQIH